MCCTHRVSELTGEGEVVEVVEGVTRETGADARGLKGAAAAADCCKNSEEEERERERERGRERGERGFNAVRLQ
ncbi:hypothetical protein JOB18_003057 [Solea senegalensis]|uniref:Uncharacterized protein n=1 Tax=Solea senegalensis TaxID=28829 RepID=A0AAV6RI70_SOLSE|nr:hypothetical protein JOB18_003057 [Solea senegalensis]